VRRACPEELLKNHPGLEAKTLFAALPRGRPGKYQGSQHRTFQRRLNRWRALEGPGPEMPLRGSTGPVPEHSLAQTHCLADQVQR
jgi:hypothetical protein